MYIYNYITIYIWLSWNKHQQKSKFDLCRNGGYSSLWQFNPYSQTNLCIWERWRGTGWTKISEDDDPKVPSWHTTPLQNSLKTPSQPKKRCTPTWFLKFCTHLRHHHSLMVHPIRVAYFFCLPKFLTLLPIWANCPVLGYWHAHIVGYQSHYLPSYYPMISSWNDWFHTPKYPVKSSSVYC